MDIHSFYHKLFEELHVPQTNDIFHKLMFEDFLFYDKYSKSRNFNKQHGGSREITFKNGKYTFTIYKVKDDDRLSFSIYNYNNEEVGDACVVLFIPIKEKYVYLDAISYYDNCAFPGMPKSRGGSLLLDTTLKFIDTIKNKYKLSYIQLKDNSFFTCHLDKQVTPMATLYMLTRGNTWYGKYGFIPFDPVRKEIDINTLVDYKTNQKLVKLVKVKHTGIRDYMKRSSRFVKGYSDKLIDSIMSNYSDMSLQKFFEDFIKKYDTRCDMFNAIYKDVMEEVGIANLNNKTYYLPL